MCLEGFFFLSLMLHDVDFSAVYGKAASGSVTCHFSHRATGQVETFGSGVWINMRAS